MVTIKLITVINLLCEHNNEAMVSLQCLYCSTNVIYSSTFLRIRDCDSKLQCVYEFCVHKPINLRYHCRKSQDSNDYYVR